jgi:hypothetical protein
MPSDRLIVERLGDETLVYDPETNEAHNLGGAAAAEFAAAPTEVSRREVLRKAALGGAASLAGASLIKTIAAPTPAQAQSAGQPCTGGAGGTCDAGLNCCGGTCCPTGQCCSGGGTTACFTLGGCTTQVCVTLTANQNATCT